MAVAVHERHERDRCAEKPLGDPSDPVEGRLRIGVEDVEAAQGGETTLLVGVERRRRRRSVLDRAGGWALRCSLV
jgi:hypothetical protein